jgi:hypothetical protein
VNSLTSSSAERIAEGRFLPTHLRGEEKNILWGKIDFFFIEASPRKNLRGTLSEKNNFPLCIAQWVARAEKQRDREALFVAPKEKELFPVGEFFPKAERDRTVSWGAPRRSVTDRRCSWR